PFVVLAAGVAALLASCGGSADLVVGTPVSRRGSAELDRMVAYLSEVLPLRLRIAPGQSFAELVAQVRRVTPEALGNREISAAELSRLVRGPGRAAGSPLVRTVIVVDDDAAGSGLELPGVAAERLHVPPGTAKFDLLVTFRAEGGGYQGFLDYA